MVNCKLKKNRNLNVCKRKNVGKPSKNRWYADIGGPLNPKRTYFKTEKDAKNFVVKKVKQGIRTGYTNEAYHLDTEWKVWSMKGDSTGKIHKEIFNDELDALRYVRLKKEQGLLTGIQAQQKGMGL